MTVANYSVDEIKEIARTTAEWRGWDLLQYRVRRAETPWQYVSVVEDFLSGKESVLDMGCGDGRALAYLSKKLRRGIGVDVSKDAVDRARLSLPIKVRNRVHFTRASSHAVPAPNGAFHVVLNRHSPLFPEEVDRVLSPGGIFITQQIGNQHFRAIMDAFDEARGPLPRMPEEVGLTGTVAAFASADYEILRQDEYDVPFVFQDTASLVYRLQKDPIPQDFDIEKDADTVLNILDRLGTPNGILTNEHRELLIVRKPE